MALLILLCWVSSVDGPHRGHVFVHQLVAILQDMLCEERTSTSLCVHV